MQGCNAGDRHQLEVCCHVQRVVCLGTLTRLPSSPKGLAHSNYQRNQSKAAAEGDLPIPPFPPETLPYIPYDWGTLVPCLWSLKSYLLPLHACRTAEHLITCPSAVAEGVLEQQTSPAVQLEQGVEASKPSALREAEKYKFKRVEDDANEVCVACPECKGEMCCRGFNVGASAASFIHSVAKQEKAWAFLHKLLIDASTPATCC